MTEIVEITGRARNEEDWTCDCPHCGKTLDFEGYFDEDDVHECPKCKGKFKVIRCYFPDNKYMGRREKAVKDKIPGKDYPMADYCKRVFNITNPQPGLCKSSDGLIVHEGPGCSNAFGECPIHKIVNDNKKVVSDGKTKT